MEVIEGNEDLASYIGLDVIGPLGCASICDTLGDLQYKHLKELKLYKSGIGDEGCKSIANFMVKSKNVKILVLPDNEITAKGCENLASVLGPSHNLPLIKLKLDFNNIGVMGLANLASTLCSNGVLERLSLNYCNIESEGSKFLQEILGYCETSLWSLKLKGNFLRNEGVYQLFRSLETN